MRKAGGIVGLIAGILGVLAAVATLFIGGLGAAFEAEGSNQIVGFGWGGILFSFLAIVFGAITMGSKGRIPGLLLLVVSIAGAILGGTLVAIVMGLSAIGGLLAVIPPSEKKAIET